jgi:hypothetical protein
MKQMCVATSEMSEMTGCAIATATDVTARCERMTSEWDKPELMNRRK